MAMNCLLSLMLVALLSKRERKRVGGRTEGSGGTAMSVVPEATILLKIFDTLSFSDDRFAGFDVGPARRKWSCKRIVRRVASNNHGSLTRKMRILSEDAPLFTDANSAALL